MPKTLSLGLAAALVAGVAMGSAGTNVMPVFIDDFASRAGLSGAGAGLVGAAQLTATAVVTLLLAGRAARTGRVALARLGLVLTAFGALWVALADDPVTLLLTNLLLGAALGIATRRPRRHWRRPRTPTGRPRSRWRGRWWSPR